MRRDLAMRRSEEGFYTPVPDICTCRFAGRGAGGDICTGPLREQGRRRWHLYRPAPRANWFSGPGPGACRIAWFRRWPS